MMQNHIPNDHISAVISPQINDFIHKHRAALPLHYFDYQRIYHNQKLMCLTSNVNFLTARIELDVPFIEPTLSEGFFLADEVFPVKELALDHQHGMYTGICIVRQDEYYTETAFFAANKQNKNCISLYLSNTQHLLEFTNQFKEDFKSAISQAEHSTIAITDKLLNTPDHNNLQHLHASGKNRLLKLSNREIIVLHYLLMGKTQSETANLMKISRSSVSTFLRRIMDKFGCSCRSELVELALEHGLLRLQALNL